MPRRAFKWLFAAVALTLPVTARANGRFPAASQLVFDPSDSKHAAVRTTFGMLQTTDGATFRWICEKSLGYEGVFDPAIAIAGGGRTLVGLPDGLSRSIDGCRWDRAGAPLAGEYIIDLAVDPNDPKRVVAVTALGDGAPMGSQAKIHVSRDGAATFSETIALPEDFRPQTIDLARGAPNRIYASGLSPFGRFAMFVRSNDGGATWIESTFDIGDASGAYIAGVDPTNADRVYLRLDGATTDDLRFSPDGGDNFSSITTGPQLLGFALSPDGKYVAVGGPGMGVHVAGRDHAFRKIADHSVRCLTWTSEALFACGSDPPDPFAIGRSNADATAPFAAVLRLADLEPLACAKDTTTGEFCPAFWPEVSRIIKPAPDAGPPDGGPPIMETGVDAAIDAPAPAPTSEPDGCGCTTPRGGHGAGAIALLLVALGIAHKRRTHA